MKPSHPSRRSRALRMGLESLEDRKLLTGGDGSTFAIVPGTISTNGGTSSFTFTIDPANFTMPKSGKITIGIDVATETGSSLVPFITGVTNSQGKPVPGTTHSTYAPGIPRTSTSYGNLTTAVLTPLSFAAGDKPTTYTVTVKGEKDTSGDYLLGFYLAGDANGDGSVSQTDITTIRSLMGDKATSSSYNFDADANRDGVINRKDLTIAEKNLGAVTTINPTVSANLNPADETALQDGETTMQTVNFTGTVTPGATVTFTDTSYPNLPTVTTTADSTGNYSVMVNLGSGSNTFSVSTVDAFGQKISGTISPVTYDTNAPTSLLSYGSTSSTSTTGSSS